MDGIFVALEEQEDEIYHKNNNNIISIGVQCPGDDKVKCDATRHVHLELTNDAKLGLGMALIRSALKNEDEFLEIYPYDYPVEHLGFYLHPNSCRLFIWTTESKESVDDIFPRKE
ncbi:hypothetical protein [Pseudodesulfovibrio sp. zrk46]|uniref:hypothetical protein n=1 Tax=Pseudodesulfovibrio sp. zrk46 TaxID=2725288 RepID=UPI001449EE8C|nr:hypothetical protein [Pseudodesulfovibrio sp. zrk46]QJB56881.1 hypothetical protein HFN16_10910 [Pseudodesulfovibrio sp. zrk46]